MNFRLLFSEYFEIDHNRLEEYGALDICIDADLPLFIDPFLLFSSKDLNYVNLHDSIVQHLVELKEIAISETHLDLRLFQFPEVKQNWLGLCKWGNQGRGLGPKFARDLIDAFRGFYSDFGEEIVSSTSHIEKLTLFGSGIGRDFISDFTTNMMYEHLLEYTQTFALKYLRKDQVDDFSVRCKFDYNLMIWSPRKFTLPYFYREENGDYILLTPIDILTKDETFICPRDLRKQFRKVATSLEDDSLREAVNLYFEKNLPKKAKKTDIDRAITATIKKYPEVLDYYIRDKENNKEKAAQISVKKIEQLKRELISTLSTFCNKVFDESDFYDLAPNSYEAALQRAMYLKEVIENNDGYRIFYKDGKAIASEDTIQRIFRLTWVVHYSACQGIKAYF